MSYTLTIAQINQNTWRLPPTQHHFGRICPFPQHPLLTDTNSCSILTPKSQVAALVGELLKSALTVTTATGKLLRFLAIFFRFQKTVVFLRITTAMPNSTGRHRALSCVLQGTVKTWNQLVGRYEGNLQLTLWSRQWPVLCGLLPNPSSDLSQLASTFACTRMRVTVKGGVWRNAEVNSHLLRNCIAGCSVETCQN